MSEYAVCVWYAMKKEMRLYIEDFKAMVSVEAQWDVIVENARANECYGFEENRHSLK